MTVHLVPKGAIALIKQSAFKFNKAYRFNFPPVFEVEMEELCSRLNKLAERCEQNNLNYKEMKEDKCQ